MAELRVETLTFTEAERQRWRAGHDDMWNATTDRGSLEKYLGDGPFENFVLSERASSWPEFLDWLKEVGDSWCFRGQREASWLLNTSLDRAVRIEHSGKNGSGYYHLDRATEQRELLSRFQAEATPHLRDCPSLDDACSWLARMQPTGDYLRYESQLLVEGFVIAS